MMEVANMRVEPQEVIDILAQRLANEMIQSAVQEAALRRLTPPTEDDAVGIPTEDKQAP